MGLIMELNKEYMEKNEEAVVNALVDEFMRVFPLVNPPGKCPALRVTHSKTLACVRGEFIIEPNLPPELQVGLFKTAKTYPAWVRFSQSFVTSDKKRDGRSLTIKVMEVPGEKLLPEAKWATTQDLPMMSGKLFFVRNVTDFLEFMRYYKKPWRFFFPNMNPLKWRLRELSLYLAQFKKTKNLLDLSYYGEVPYRFGERTMKYHVEPRSENSWKHSIPPSDNFLHQVTAEFLKTREAYFDFFIQFQTDPVKMPIEDATVEWNSPFYKVATLKIFSQDIDAPENKDKGENLIYNPWHCLIEHQPVGGINRARRLVYNATIKKRLERNKIDYQEP
jgi:hypothetical protein